MTSPPRLAARRLWVTALYAIAMAFVEASVVVYLRALYYPDRFVLPSTRRFLYFYHGEPPGLLPALPPLHLRVEIVREAATMVMLAAVGWLAGTARRDRLAYFLFAFGLWDIFYYVFLRITLGWPQSLGTVDLLFLIPVPWVGPVWMPLLASLVFVGGGAWWVVRDSRAAEGERVTLATSD